MDYQLLGPLRATSGTQPLTLGGLRQRAVLAVLLLSSERVVDCESLIEQVWQTPPPKPITSLRAYVANLRRILAVDGCRDRLVSDGGGYRLRLADDRVDSELFESGVAKGRRLLRSGDRAAASRVLAGALALWRGDPLWDFRDQPFAGAEIHRLQALRVDAVEAFYEAELRQGRGPELIGGLEREVADNPLREQLWAQLMVAMYRAGRRADALGAHRRLRDTLERELGIGPGVELDRLADDIRDETADFDWFRA
jgi:DNA-binding SARP family transcriptional activator